MTRIIWTPPASKPASGSRAAPDGLIATLRDIACGQEVLVVGRKTPAVGGHIAAARRGSTRWYSSRTIAAGALIVRTE